MHTVSALGFLTGYKVLDPQGEVVASGLSLWEAITLRDQLNAA